MLVLSRRIGETICIGDNVKLTLLGKNNQGKVRLAISAPKDITIETIRNKDDGEKEQEMQTRP